MTSANEKTVPMLAHRDGQVETGLSDTAITASESILHRRDAEHKSLITSVLPQGAENAITGAELVRLLNLKNGRELTRLIEQERRNGVPVCASTDSHNPGYYIAESADELEAYINSLDRRVTNISKTLSYCVRTLEKMQG